MTDSRQNVPTDYDEYVAYMQAVTVAVKCPRCKAEASEACVWGGTNSGTPHTPRVRKYQRS